MPQKRNRKVRLLFIISILCVITCIIIVAVILVANGKKGDKPDPSQISSQTAVSTDSADTGGGETSFTPSDMSGTTASIADDASSEASANSSNGQPVQDNSFFEDAAFIGNSRTEGLMLYTGLDNATFYTHKGLKVDTFFTDKIIRSGEKKVTILDAMKGKSFKKIYIMLGLNELGWVYDHVFIKKYGDVIDAVKSAQPNASIYVQSILPVTKKKSNEDKIYNNTKISQYNTLIEKMAKEKGVIYLNVGESVGTDGGALPQEAATDGIHMNKAYCMKWLDYLRTHAGE